MKNIFYIALVVLLVSSCKTKKDSSSVSNKVSKNDTTAIRLSQAIFIDGMTEKIKGNYEKATFLFETSIQKYPRNAAAMYQLSGLYDISGRSIPAMEMTKKAVEIDPNNKWYLVQLAYLYNRNLMYKEAIQTFEKLIKKYPDDVDNYYPYTDVLLKNNQYAKAIETLTELEKIIGFDEQLVFNKYRLYAQDKKYDEAMVEIQKLIDNDPAEVSNYGIAAEIYLSKGDKATAMTYYEKILQLDPNNGMVHLALSDFYHSQNDEARSLEELQKAFSSTSLEVDTKMKILLDYYYRPGDEAFKKEAYDLIERMEKAHPTSAKPFAIHGDFLIADEKIQEARDKYREACKLDKDKFVVWGQLLTLDAELKDFESLHSESKEALDLFPTQAQFYYLNGYAAFQLKKYKEAAESLETGKALLVDNPDLEIEFLQMLGDTYHKLAKHSLSDETYEKALKLNPENVYVLNNYAFYLGERKTKLFLAAEMALKCNTLAPDKSNYEDTYGWILFLQKKYTEAERWLKKAIDHGGSSSGVILEHYGDILFHLDKKTEALEYWNKAKEKGGHSTILEKKITDKNYYE